MSINPDPKKFVVRFRKGKPVLLERENLEAIKRWREKRAKAAPVKPPLEALADDLSPDRQAPKGRVAKMQNLFTDEDT